MAQRDALFILYLVTIQNRKHAGNIQKMVKNVSMKGVSYEKQDCSISIVSDDVRGWLSDD